MRVACAPGILQHTFDPALIFPIPSLSPRARLPDATDLALVAHACTGADVVVAVAGRAFPAAVAATQGVPILFDLLSNDLFVGDTPEICAAVRDAAARGHIVAHALDDAQAHAVRYGFNAQDVRFVPLPIERSLPSAPPDRLQFAANGELLVLSAARLDDDHAAYFPALFEAVSALRERGFPLRLVVVGDGTHAQRLQAVAPPAVCFLGFRSDLDALYALADVYVGEGSSRLEAALAGVPVVSSCAQTHPQVADRALFLFGLQHGTLHAYPPSSATPLTTFAQAIALVLENRHLAQRVAARARTRVEREHAPQRFVSFLERFVANEDLERGAAALTPPSIVLDVPCEPQAIIAAARRAAAEPGVAITLSSDLAWAQYANLPEDTWDPLADATRRSAIHCTHQTARPSPLLP